MAGCVSEPLSTESPDNSLPRTVTAIVGRIEPALSAVEVTAVSLDGQTVTTVTDKEGRFRLEELSAGTYHLIVSASGYFTDTSVRDVSIEEGQEAEVPAVRLRSLNASAILEGSVVDGRTLEPLSGVQVVVQCNAGVCAAVNTITDAKGGFRVKIWAELSATLHFRRDGYRQEAVVVPPQRTGETYAVSQVGLESIAP